MRSRRGRLKLPRLSSAQQWLLGASALVAVVYGLFGSSLYTGLPPYMLGAACKASSIVILGLVALLAGSRLLGAGLFFGALGDALLAWSHDAFLLGAIAFLIGHLYYIAVFLRAGIGMRASLRDWWRVCGVVTVLIPSAFFSLFALPAGHPLYAPILVYVVVLTLMVGAANTLPKANEWALTGAILFYISDGFVALHLLNPNFHDPLALFAGWMIYWAGQAGICVGALGLHKSRA